MFLSHDLLSRFDAPVPIIVAVRHPADVAISAAHYLAQRDTDEERAAIRRLWGPVRKGGLEAQIAHAKVYGHRMPWWKDYVRATVPHHLVRLEDLRQDTPGVFRRILDALELEADDSRIMEEIARQQAFALSQGLGLRVWREYFDEEERRAFAKKYAAVLDLLGYEMEA